MKIEKLNIGDVVKVTTKSEQSKKTIKGIVIGDYPKYYLLRVCGKGGYWNETILKNDLMRGDIKVKYI